MGNSYSYYGYLDGYFYNDTNSFQAVAGQTYYICVSGYYYPSAVGTFQLNWSSSAPLAPPGNYTNATSLTGVWGSITQDNTDATPLPGEPSIAGFAPNAPVWYQWTAPQDGEVALDTIGSVGDTVLAVYTGSSLTALNQVAANDDLFPVNSALAMYNYSTAFVPSTAVSSGGITVSSSGGVELFSYYQDYYGPSGLRFTARAGTTYYFAVDTKSTSQRGLITLNWAYKSSGVFRWATEDVDPYASIISSSYNVEYMPLYKTSDYESEPPDGAE